MDRTHKLNYQRDVEQYLEKNKVYDIFENLMKDLVIDQPAQPLDYLIKKLSEPQQKRVFVVGPPGSKTTELALQLANEFKYTCISVGNLLKKQISMKNTLGEEIENSIQKVGYVRDEIVIDIVKNEIEEMERKKQNYLLEGFPKTRVQGLALQRVGIIPESFIILNQDEKSIKQSCYNKISSNQDGYYSNIPLSKVEEYAANHALEYTLNLNHVKEVYARYFFEVDVNNVSSDGELLEDMARLMEFKNNPKGPKRSARILVIGPPGSGRSTLAKKLAQKYGLVYVSTTELISDQIAKKTEVGRVALNLLNRGELVPDEIINGLVDNRLKQTDCHLQGYVLDGYPKSLVQLLCLEDLNINPSLIVELECSDELVIQRFQGKKDNPNESIENIKKRLQRWKELLRSMEQTYSRLIYKVSATLPPKNILENVCFHLENSG
ncbi:hypothetical protein ABPG74_007809 [Tetrahymena malaccensis]